MKKHAIIPVFIPHKGCPNDCVFCNQRKITARSGEVSPEDVRAIIENHLTTLRGRGLESIEMAFFGGSFTGIPMEEQSAYLTVAREYKDRGEIDKIHLSTRPDYIDEKILDNLKAFGTDTIELGVQSFDDEVLRLSNRGHDSEAVEKSSALIKAYGFELGIQLMIGLPGDTKEKSLYSARRAAAIAPEIGRIYPTVVIKETALWDMYQSGKYRVLTTAEAVDTAKEMYRILTEAGVKIIRIGLKSSDLIGEGENSQVAGNSYHPAIRQLVEGEIAREDTEAKLRGLFVNDSGDFAGSVMFSAGDRCFSNLIGHKGVNKTYFEKKYPQLNICWKRDSSLAEGSYNVIKLPGGFV